MADDVCLLAVKSNGLGVGERLTMEHFIYYMECEIIKYPSMNSGVTISKIDDFHLIVDKDNEPLLEIIEIESVELPPLDFDQSAN
jgi:hypothetical protein